MDEQELFVTFGNGWAQFTTPDGATVHFQLEASGEINAGSRREFNPLKLPMSAFPSTERCEQAWGPYCRTGFGTDRAGVLSEEQLAELEAPNGGKTGAEGSTLERTPEEQALAAERGGALAAEAEAALEAERMADRGATEV